MRTELATGPDHAWVTLVSEDCGSGPGQASEGEGAGFTWYRGSTFRCALESSDARVSGTLTGVFGDDCCGDPDVTCVFWNSKENAGPEGSSTGWVRGTHRSTNPASTMAAPVATSVRVFTGHGAYDGLTFLVHGLGFLGEQDFYGLTYEGAPPPLNELVPVGAPKTLS